MGTDVCPKCGRGGGEAVLCFCCNGCPGHCICDDQIKRIKRERPSMILDRDHDGQCKHGKGLTDYCEPCERINGG